MTREQWITNASDRITKARRIIDSMLIDAKRLEDTDINEACERLGDATEALTQASLAIGIGEEE